MYPVVKHDQDAFAFVKEYKLSWMRFRKITGRVETKDLFRENLWTPQFREILAAASGIIWLVVWISPKGRPGTSLLTEPTTRPPPVRDLSLPPSGGG
jgi:hypothetical protein